VDPKSDPATGMRLAPGLPLTCVTLPEGASAPPAADPVPLPLPLPATTDGAPPAPTASPAAQPAGGGGAGAGGRGGAHANGSLVAGIVLGSIGLAAA
jgi:hypothetical protein